MSNLIPFPDKQRKTACPHRQYLSARKREARSELAVFGLMGSCGLAALILFAFGTYLPGTTGHPAALQASNHSIHSNPPAKHLTNEGTGCLDCVEYPPRTNVTSRKI